MKFVANILILALVVALVAVPAHARGDVSTAKAARLVKNRSTIVLDVRTPEEFRSGHLRRARLLNYYDTDFWTRVALLPKESTIVVYCRSGRRSKDTETKLLAMGYLHVYNMLGGFDAWNKEKLPFEK